MWGFSIVWFFVAVAMIATSGGFPFNMGWWGFIFPVGMSRFCPSVSHPKIIGTPLTDLNVNRSIHALDDLYWRRAGVAIF